MSHMHIVGIIYKKKKKKVDHVLADTEAIFWVEGGQIINK